MLPALLGGLPALTLAAPSAATPPPVLAPAANTAARTTPPALVTTEPDTRPLCATEPARRGVLLRTRP